MEKTNSNKIIGIDYFKIIAAVMVVLYHAAELLPFSVDGAGVIGVSIFIQASGFCIGIGAEKYRQSSPKTLDYLRRKVKRFYPMHCLGLLLVLSLNIRLRQQNRLLAFLVNLLLIQSWFPTKEFYFSYNGVSWYLSDLIFFWILTPFLIRWINRRVCRKARELMALYGGLFFFLCLISMIGAKTRYAHFILYIFPPVRGMEYTMAVCAGAAYKSFLKDFFGHRWVQVIAILLYSFSIIVYPNLPTYYTYSCLYIIPTTVVICAAAALPKFGCSQIVKIVSSKLMDVFLLHQVVFVYMKRLFLDIYPIPRWVALLFYAFLLIATIMVVEYGISVLQNKIKRKNK